MISDIKYECRFYTFLQYYLFQHDVSDIKITNIKKTTKFNNKATVYIRKNHYLLNIYNKIRM